VSERRHPILGVGLATAVVLVALVTAGPAQAEDPPLEPAVAGTAPLDPQAPDPDLPEPPALDTEPLDPESLDTDSLDPESLDTKPLDPEPPRSLSAELLAAGATTLTPVAPCRLLDTRKTPTKDKIAPTTWRIPVTGRCGLPAGARAVAFSLVATNTSAEGFLTLWSGETALPTVSNLNFARGNTVANSAVVQVSAAGTIDLFASVGTDVIVDVSGAFVPVAEPVAAGRFVPVTPRRVLDTRRSGQRGATDLVVPLPADIPADATALAVGVTAVDAASDGFMTVHAARAPRPDASAVNVDQLNRTRANVVFVPVDTAGFVVHRSMTTDVIVDVWGWFTGPSAVPGEDGLFVPRAPVRVWDSRHSLDPVHPGGTVEKQFAPPQAAALVVNTTVVEPTGWGFLSVLAAGTPRPEVSSLNYRWRHPVAALTVTRNSTRGMSVYSFAGAHLVVDFAGWFTGAPVPAVAPPPANPQPAPTTPVIFISDSSFAGIRWSGSLPLLQGATFDNRLESCRRLVGVSCRGREGRTPPTALAELAGVPVGRYKVAIIGTGYNDSAGVFPAAFQAIIDMARSKKIDRVIWMTYRERVSYVSPSRFSNSLTFASHNRVLRAAAASGNYPELIIADWHNYTIDRPDWLTADGVHFTSSGARAAAQYVSRTMASIERRVCPAGVGGPSAPGGWCAAPDVTGPPG
jgi:hypothetical protein